MLYRKIKRAGKPTVKLKSPNWFVGLYFKYKGPRLLGWCSCWNTIYIRPGYQNCNWLIAHEMHHIKQMESEGKIKMMIKYLYFQIKYGYKSNPYEVSAYVASDDVKYGNKTLWESIHEEL